MSAPATGKRNGDPLFRRVALLGAGLIGSSLAWAIRGRGLAEHVAAYSRRAETRATIERLGFADSLYGDPDEAVKGADLVVFCVPVGANAAVAAEVAPHIERGAIVTDVGSVKQAVIRDIGPLLPEGVEFIPGHPIAGTEQRDAPEQRLVRTPFGGQRAHRAAPAPASTSRRASAVRCMSSSVPMVTRRQSGRP